jgi:predicted enzyme involved in methoxymalonyl-ACP biosynthesis
MLSLPAAIGMTLNLADKFGDHGLIAVILAVPVPGQPEETLAIDTWLMSCRVIGRTAEEFLFNELAGRARSLGYQWLLGEFSPTGKNAMVADLFDRLRFERVAESPGGAVTYRYPLTDSRLARTYIQALQGPLENIYATKIGTTIPGEI